MRTLANNMIEIPNSKLGTSVITNFDLPEEEMT
jgi:small-conductance mechanosensitive channel